MSEPFALASPGPELGWACFSPDGKHRYVLRRTWDPRPHLLFAGMNPSKAGAVDNDPTVNLLRGFAKRARRGGLIIVNAHSIIETYSKKLPHTGTIGPDQWVEVRQVLRGAYGAIHGDVLCGWGDAGAGDEADYLLELIESAGLKPVAIALTKRGNPGHPLRKRLDVVPVELPAKEVFANA